MLHFSHPYSNVHDIFFWGELYLSVKIKLDPITTNFSNYIPQVLKDINSLLLLVCLLNHTKNN